MLELLPFQNSRIDRRVFHIYAKQLGISDYSADEYV